MISSFKYYSDRKFKVEPETTLFTAWGKELSNDVQKVFEQISNYIQYQEEIGCGYNNAIKNLYLKLYNKINPNYDI